MEKLQKIAHDLPHVPGVYIYKNNNGEVIYIGKAKDLQKRVSSYFSRDDAVGAKTATLVSQIASIETIITDNEFDALLLEAKLIRAYLPRYNVISRDDKSPLYIVITHEKLPHIIWLRKTSLSHYPNASIFGPFQSGRTARFIMRSLRSVIPYCTQKVRNGKPCFYTHIGLCRPCPSAILNKEQERAYRSNIRKIIAILSGNSPTVLHAIEKEMAQAAKDNKFEEAHVHKMRLEGLHRMLERHFDPTMYLTNTSLANDIREEERNELENILHVHPIHRIECIDISNTGGSYATGSVVVFIDGLASKQDYRRFKIRTQKAPNDYAMIAEVVHRRFAHPEWPRPDLLVIDGGKGQVKAASASPVPTIGLAKRFEEIIVQGAPIRLPINNKGLQLLMRIRDESHRFALTYHRLLRAKTFLTN